MKRIDARPHELVEVLRRAHIERSQIALRARPQVGTTLVRFVAGKDARIDIDAENSLADIDGALTLSSAAGRLARIGSIFPIARPLPPLPLAVACAAMPFFVDAFVHSANLLTFDGDPYDTPRAPRSAAGPALLYAACTRPPLALAVRAKVRVIAASRSHSWRETHGDLARTAARMRQLVDEARAFSVDASGTSILVLAAASVPPKGDAAPFSHQGRGRSTEFGRSTSIAAGDVGAIEQALARGARVVAAPQMGRVAALSMDFEHLPVLDVPSAIHDLAKALERTGGEA